MSLKKSLKKSIAAFIALTIVYSNCYLCGIGVSKVIAEEIREPEIEIKLENSKYVEYQTEEYTGIVIQTNLEFTTDQEEDTYLPTNSVQVLLNLPQVNGYFPEKANVVLSNTCLSTGEKDNNKINQNYDTNSGLLKVFYENNEMYSEYTQGMNDKFEIIYIYPAQAYTENQEEISLEYTAEVTMSFLDGENLITTQKTENFTIQEKDNRGDLLTFGVTELKDEIYKGFMYSNVKNGTNYDTEFKTVSTLCVLNSNINQEIVLEENANEFVINTEEETTVSSNGLIQYIATGINRNEFDKILGTNGSIEFYQEENVISSIKYLEIEEEKKLAIISADGQVNFVNDDDKTLIVEYPENLTNLKIKLSPAVAEGYINFENQNVIKASKDYGYELEKILGIKTSTTVNENITDVKLLMAEPKTKVSVSLSNSNFSTLQKSTTTLTINLDDTNSSTKLFNAPTITVKLPEGLVGGNLSSTEIVNGNRLEIEDAFADGNNITIKLKGEQKAYDLTNVSGGTSIVMDIENMEFENTIPTHTDKIEVTCIQGKEEVVASHDVNIISKSGLLMLNELSNYDDSNNTITVMNNTTQIVEVESQGQEREVVNTLNLINNYDEDLSNVQIIGKIGYSNDELTSTFDTLLTKPIELNVNNAQIYYSVNKDASYDDDSWTSEFTSEARTVKIVFNDNIFAKASNIQLKEYVQVPQNLGTNQETYLKWDVEYTYKEREIQENIVLGMATKNEQNIFTLEQDDIQLTLITPEDEAEYENPGEVNIIYQQNQTVVYKAKIKNISENKLNNIKITHDTPQGLEYITGGTAGYTVMGYEIQDEGKLNDNKFEYTIKELEVGEETFVIIKYTIKGFGAISNSNINTKVNATIGDRIYESNTKTIKISQAIYEMTLTSNIQEGEILKVGDTVTYTINVKNIGDRIGTFTISNTVPDKIAVNKVEYGNLEENLNVIITASNNIELSMDLNKEETKVVKLTGTVEEQEVEETTVFNLMNIANLIVGNEVITSKTLELQLEVEAKKSEDTGELEDENGSGQNPDDYISGDIDQHPEDNVGDDVLQQPEENPDNENNQQPEENPDDENNQQPEEDPDDENNQQPEENPDDNNNQQPEENPDDENNQQPEENPDDNNNQQPEDNKNKEELYSISGVAWIDLNRNGQKDSDEKLQHSVVVSLVDMTTGNFALDTNGNRVTTVTDSEGKYTFSNVKEGTYVVLFEFDTNTFTVTTYKKEAVSVELNSDVILSNVTIDGQEKLAAVTDKIDVKENKENIDIGLIENATFDLSLNKEIIKITVINSKGTETYEYEDGETAKVDLVAKYMNGANVIVTYRFTVKNEGDVSGYVNSLVDNLPTGLEFSSELNENWYKGNDGQLYTTALSGREIKPGESTQIELVLTKNMTEDNAGIFPNNAELEKISNLQNIKEKEETLENNQSSANLIISIKTGSIALYTGITTICLAIICIGIYFIKKKVLNRGI